MNAFTSNQHFACTVAGDILNSDNPNEAAEQFTSLLDQVFQNDSFTKIIISGGVSQEFEGNIFLEKLWLCADFCGIIFFVLRYTLKTFPLLSLLYFVANIAKVNSAVDLLSEAANSADLETNDLNKVQASLQTVKQLLELLANVGEGSG